MLSEMRFSGFLKQVGLVLLGTAILGAYPLYAYADDQIIWSIVVGAGICTVNVLVGCFAAVWSFPKPQQVFLKTVFGGMAIRMVAIGLSFFLLIKYANVHVSALTGGLFLFYVLFQILEIRFLVGHLTNRQASNEGV